MPAQCLRHRDRRNIAYLYSAQLHAQANQKPKQQDVLDFPPHQVHLIQLLHLPGLNLIQFLPTISELQRQLLNGVCNSQGRHLLEQRYCEMPQ